MSPLIFRSASAGAGGGIAAPAAGLFGLLVTLMLVPATGHAMLPAQAPAPPWVRLSDPDLFQVMASTQQVSAGWLDSERITTCSEREQSDGTVGCQPFAARPKPLGYASLRHLTDILPRCTWVRDPESASVRPVLEWGATFRASHLWVDLGIALDSMTVFLFAPGERPVRGIVPEALKPDLATVVARVEASAWRSIVFRKWLIQRWGPSIESPPWAPCDSASASEGEFVYFDEPPAPITTVNPVRPERMPPEPKDRSVILHVLVDDSGHVCAIKVKRGDPILARAAIDAVEQWIFKPALSHGKPVSVWVEVPVVFR